MGILNTIAVAIAVLAVLGTIGFNVNKEAKYGMCFLANVGYLDFLGPAYNTYWEKCIVEVSTDFLKRDYKEGGGSISKIHEVDCTNGFSFEQMSKESNGFTKPFICRNLLKDNKCRQWTLDTMQDVAKEGEWLKLLDLGNATYTRKAFTTTGHPFFMISAPEGFAKLKDKLPYFVSFDNSFLTEEHPELIEQMDLESHFPGMKFLLNTLFISNFPHKLMGSPFHAAPNDNFLFQCRGRKHWYYMEPKYLPYVGAYIANGVTFVSEYANEVEIVDRLPLYEAIIEEGDVMYNPPYWLHAVGTPTGLSISIANRVWQDFFVQRDPSTFLWDALYKIQFPQFAAKVAVGRVYKKIYGTALKFNYKMREMGFEGGVIPAGVLPIVD